jgi:hypothetical protein
MFQSEVITLGHNNARVFAPIQRANLRMRRYEVQAPFCWHHTDCGERWQLADIGKVPREQILHRQPRSSARSAWTKAGQWAGLRTRMHKHLSKVEVEGINVSLGVMYTDGEDLPINPKVVRRTRLCPAEGNLPKISGLNNRGRCGVFSRSRASWTVITQCNVASMSLARLVINLHWVCLPWI